MKRTLNFTGALAVVVLLMFMQAPALQAQQRSYFVDGYHGGIWGHFPYKYASFIAQQMQQHPAWKVNLEIEPVTWDSIRLIDPEGYRFIRQQLSDSSPFARMEYVNPAYGQAYMFNISGESIIRQLAYGMRTLRRHFPGISFSTYSSEEPCFTSALPGILRSFGFTYASLKNPNTCWGGYTRAHGGELVRWVGPDGTGLLTVPRYATEKLEAGSTWQTTAWRNDPAYLRDARAYGISHPVGMCLQDAGWRQGPWLGAHAGAQAGPENSTRYTTWKQYFSEILKTDTDKSGALSTAIPDWKLSQEDILVSLVWGGQILQKVAAAVRKTENRLTGAETVAALDHFFYQHPWPQQVLDEAWKNLLLSQHHDTWIVPYNKKHGITWQQQVGLWTDTALHISDSLIAGSSHAGNRPGNKVHPLRIYNTSGRERTAVVHYRFHVAAAQRSAIASMSLRDPAGNPVNYQMETSADTGQQKKDSIAVTVHFEASAPPLGFATYLLIPGSQDAPARKSLSGRSHLSARMQPLIRQLKNGDFLVETDLYKVRIDPKKGGIIDRLLLKGKNTTGRHSRSVDFLTDSDSVIGSGIGELRGYFYKEGRFHSSQDQPAKVSVLTNGPLYAELKIEGMIGNTPFTQHLSLSRPDPLIRTRLTIDWQKGAIPGIGAYSQQRSFQNEDPRKAFYNSRYKLLTLFPVNIHEATLTKDAPFDIYRSGLDNTFYNSWDSIKNDVLLHWVNIDRKDKSLGFALFSDATTSYAHGEGLPLGLTTQYIGRGLFGANYTVEGPTELRYAFMPHSGDWKAGGVSQAAEDFNKPLLLTAVRSQSYERAPTRLTAGKESRRGSFLSIDTLAGWEVSAFKVGSFGLSDITTEQSGDGYVLRLFNAVGADRAHWIQLSGGLANSGCRVEVIGLDGRRLRSLPLDQRGRFRLRIPPLGVKTVRILQKKESAAQVATGLLR